MDFGRLQTQFTEGLAVINDNVSAFLNFVGNKLNNFKKLSLGEQIAYLVIGFGLLLILISIVLFIV